MFCDALMKFHCFCGICHSVSQSWSGVIIMTLLEIVVCGNSNDNGRLEELHCCL